MEINEFTIQIIFLGFPGILCFFVLSRLIGKSTRGTFEKIALVFLYSVSSYLLYYLTRHYIFGDSNYAIDTIFNNREMIKGTDILGASGAAIFLAFFLSVSHTYNLLNRFGQLIRVTHRYGDEDVWHFFLNAPDKQKNKGWVLVRDHGKNLIYYGWVDAWSESGEDRELLLLEVSVLDNDSGDELYQCQSLYVCAKKENITIEVQKEDDNHDG